MRSAERGAGLVATFAGLVVFLVFLLFTVQVLVGLWATSAVTATAVDAARRVAGEAARDRPAARVDAEREARRVLGRFAERVRFHWDVTADEVVLHVQARQLRFVPPLLGGLAPDGIDRTVRLRLERER